MILSSGWAVTLGAIAEHADDPSPGKMQHLLGGARWDAMAVMAAVPAFDCDRLEEADAAGEAVAILDKSGAVECTVFPG